MKKIFFLFSFFFLSYSFSQSSIITAERPEDLEDSTAILKPSKIEYASITDDDVLWSKVIYEEIDLNEKLNFPLLFPLESDNNYGNKRMSLWKIIKKGINDGKIKRVFNPRNDNFILSEEIKIKDSIIDKFASKYDPGDDIAQQFAGSKDIKKYRIKGVYYFDKRSSELKYKLIGLQPLGKDLKNPKVEEPTPYFWIWYDEIRELLSQHLVFNDRNNNNSISFDDLLVNRRFNSYIYKYNNVYGDREIKDYIKPRVEIGEKETDESYRIRFILESERIKKEILDFENDMWGY